VYNTITIGLTAIFIGFIALFQELHTELQAGNSSGVELCPTWFSVFSGISIVVLAASLTAINVKQGGKLGEDVLEHVSDDSDLKDAVVKVCTNLGVVNALIFSCAVSMTVSSPAGHPCSYISQTYFVYTYVSLASSFYGILTAVLPVCYIAPLDEDGVFDYLQDKTNIRGIGSAFTSMASSGLLLIAATALFGWSRYGRYIGIGQLLGLLFLFIGTINKVAYQQKWAPVVKGDRRRRSLLQKSCTTQIAAFENAAEKGSAGQSSHVSLPTHGWKEPQQAP